LSEVPQKACFDLRWVRVARWTLPLGAGGQCRKEITELGAAAARQNGHRRWIELSKKGDKRIGKERVRNATFYWIRSSNSDRPALLRGAVGDGGREPGFADAAFTDDQHGAPGAA
jgi:hypothetical protein